MLSGTEPSGSQAKERTPKFIPLIEAPALSSGWAVLSLTFMLGYGLVAARLWSLFAPRAVYLPLPFAWLSSSLD
jgi:hypothetical protein